MSVGIKDILAHHANWTKAHGDIFNIAEGKRNKDANLESYGNAH